MYIVQKSLIKDNNIIEQSHYVSLNIDKVHDTYEKAVLNELKDVLILIGVLDSPLMEHKNLKELLDKTTFQFKNGMESIKGQIGTIDSLFINYDSFKCRYGIQIDTETFVEYNVIITIEELSEVKNFEFLSQM